MGPLSQAAVLVCSPDLRARMLAGNRKQEGSRRARRGFRRELAPGLRAWGLASAHDGEERQWHAGLVSAGLRV